MFYQSSYNIHNKIFFLNIFKYFKIEYNIFYLIIYNYELIKYKRNN